MPARQDKSTGNFPIHIAAQNGHRDILKILLDAKANVDAQNNNGLSPLHMSVEYDYYWTSQVRSAPVARSPRLQAGSTPRYRNTRSEGSEGVLWITHVARGETQLLVKAGANPELENGEVCGNTANCCLASVHSVRRSRGRRDEDEDEDEDGGGRVGGWSLLAVCGALGGEHKILCSRQSR